MKAESKLCSFNIGLKKKGGRAKHMRSKRSGKGCV